MKNTPVKSTALELLRSLLGQSISWLRTLLEQTTINFKEKKKKAEVSPDLACRELTMEIFKGFHYNNPIILKRYLKL